MKPTNITWDVERIKKITMENIEKNTLAQVEKPPRPFQKIVAIIGAIIMLLFATTALAVTGIIDFSSVFSSIFNNQAAAPYVQTGDDILVQVNESEVEVNLLAIFVDSSRVGGVYLELEIIDPSGEKLSDSLLLLLYDEGLAYQALNLHMPVEVQWIDAYTIHAGLFLPFVEIDDLGDILIRFSLIATHIQRAEALSTGFVVGKHIGIDAPVVLPSAEFVEITSITQEGSSLTVAHQQSDPMLHGWGVGMLGLMGENGEIIWPNRQSSTHGVPGQESIFHIGIEDPSTFTFVWTGEFSRQLIPGDWAFTISGDILLNPETISGYYEDKKVEITLGATSVEVVVFGEIDIFQDNPLVLTLADGTTIEPSFNGAEGGRDMATLQYSMDFIHPEDVVEVRFRGVEIG